MHICRKEGKSEWCMEVACDNMLHKRNLVQSISGARTEKSTVLQSFHVQSCIHCEIIFLKTGSWCEWSKFWVVLHSYWRHIPLVWNFCMHTFSCEATKRASVQEEMWGDEKCCSLRFAHAFIFYQPCCLYLLKLMKVVVKACVILDGMFPLEREYE